MKSLERLSVPVVACLQAVALFSYVVFIGWLMSHAEGWLSDISPLIGTIFFLGVFTTSALVSAALTLAYPTYAFWKEKNFPKSIRLVLATILWLFVFLTIFAVWVFS